MERFVVADKTTGIFIASIYAERVMAYGPEGVHFYVGDTIIASVETRYVTIGGTVRNVPG